MNPVSFEHQNVVYGEKQPEYNPLPAHKDAEGTVTSCWELSPEELEIISKTGRIYLSQLTFNKALQPVRLSLDFAPPVTREEVIDESK